MKTIVFDLSLNLPPDLLTIDVYHYRKSRKLMVSSWDLRRLETAEGQRYLFSKVQRFCILFMVLKSRISFVTFYIRAAIFRLFRMRIY